MKKNKMMRIASVLLVAVLLSTCAISGTFAKYVTTDSGRDSARVAKFGVVVSIADDMNMFHTSYKTDNTRADAASAAAVYTATDNTLVAPGTMGWTSFTITGTPEVRTAITVDTSNSKAIILTAGTYTLEAGEYLNDRTNVVLGDDETYEPIRFYFGTDAITDNTVYDMTMAELKTALGELAVVNDPGTPLDETYYIGWKWAFDNTNTGTQIHSHADFFDTYLAKSGTEQMILDLTITVTQVD